MKAKILILCNSDLSLDSRAQRIIRSLQRAGATTIVLYPFRFSMATEFDSLGALIEQPLPELKLARVSDPKTQRCFLFKSTYFAQLLRARYFSEGCPDAIYFNRFEMAPLAFALKSFGHTKLIFDVRDYSRSQQSEEAGGFFERYTHLFKNLVYGHLEARVLPKVDGMLTVVDEIRTLCREHYYLPQPFEVIYNRFEFVTEYHHIGWRNRLPHPDYFLFVFSGWLSRSRAVDRLIQAIAQIPNASLAIIGEGSELPLLKRMTAQLDLKDRVIFFPMIKNQASYISFLSEADCAICSATPDSINRKLALSNKFWAAAMAGLPILAGESAVEQKMISELQIGLPLSLASVASTRDSMLAMVAKSDKWHAMKKRLKDFRHTLSWEDGEQALIRLFETVVKS